MTRQMTHAFDMCLGMRQAEKEAEVGHESLDSMDSLEIEAAAGTPPADTIVRDTMLLDPTLLIHNLYCSVYAIYLQEEETYPCKQLFSSCCMPCFLSLSRATTLVCPFR